MADNIIIKITTEADLDAAQKQLQALTDKMKQQEKAARDLSDQEKADAETIRQTVAIRERQKKALAENQRYYREEKEALKEQAKETKASIKELEKQIKGYKTFTGQSGKMVQQLRAMREELQRMEDSGEFGTQAFMDLAIAAGQLEDQIGDTQARIRVLSSDTIGLDTAMGVADGLTGAFYVATSAAEVFGSDMEALQEAFYRVQAAISVVSGVQQIANTLNKDSVVSVVAQTAAAKLKQKVLAKNAALTAADTTATIANTAATGAQTVITKIATKAQIGLNTAIAANPLAWLIGLIVAAVAAVGGLAYGLYKLVSGFTDAGKAQKQYAKASKELEEIQRKNAIAEAERSFQRQEEIRKTSEEEEKALIEAEGRNATEMEIAEIKLKYAKEREEQTKRYAEAETKRNNAEVAKLKEMMNAKQAEVNSYKDGSKKKKEAEEQLTEATQKYYEALQKTKDLEAQVTGASNEVKRAENEIKNIKKSSSSVGVSIKEMRQQLNQLNIDLMKEGQEKEIEQIKLGYKQQIAEVKGNSKVAKDIRKALKEKEAKEIEEVTKKYALQERQVRLKEEQNTLDLLAQLGGNEKNYEEQMALARNIAKQEAQIKIDSLEKSKMSEEEYAAEVQAIRIELNNKLRQIGEEEIARQEDFKRKKTELVIAEAELETKLLTGSEPLEHQKKVYEKWFNERKNQLNQNAELEIAAINRSTDTEEVKVMKIKQIHAGLESDLLEMEREMNETLIGVDAQYLDELQRNIDKAQRDVERTQGGARLDALEDRFEAEQDLYSAQLDNLDAQYDAGLITYQEYENQRWEITKATEDSIAAYRQEKMQTILDGFNMALGYMQQVSDLAFEAINNNIQAEMDALDEMYTTDAEEAKENANKRYISEKELADKKAALEMKQAKYAKAQALINAGINTALAITNALTTSPFPLGIAMAAIAAAMGAAQIGVIAAKPLAQYAKGRKGGPGEYALVGERGPELMYVPQGASIVPNHYLGDMDAWSKFGVPALPNDMMSAAMLQQINIDYDRLGKAVAANIPQQKAVSVNVDRRGVTINDNGNRRTYLNHKYAGSWS
jgi:hypothetical protein